MQFLLVEDDDLQGRNVIRAIQKARITNRIAWAEDGMEAIEILNGCHPWSRVSPPLIVLLDLTLPRMSGLEFLRTLRADPRFQSLVCFVLTGSDKSEDIAAAYDLNVAGVIEKSRVGEDFRSLLRLLESYWTVVRIPGDH
ncbi:response regulator [Mangrovicoccus sp. HB161399]|uniref:response regulator n=1 Tax=Mangrovicoccus sp. HB161399 TaxID=2720392 RepID=UPI00155518C5